MSRESDQPPHPSIDSVDLLFRRLPRHPKLSVADKRALHEFASILSEQVAAAPFLCLITNDRELQRLNRAFLGHDYPTDVLSFPSAIATGGVGEIAISLERAQVQAQQYGHGHLDELRILMLHGALHLSGFDHESDHGEMGRLERQWRKSLRLPSSLIARSRHRQKAVTA